MIEYQVCYVPGAIYITLNSTNFYFSLFFANKLIEIVGELQF